MPIYEYRCQDCDATFDKFVRSMSTEYEVECPECHSKNCKKSFSMFGTSGGSTRGLSSSASSCAPSG